MSRVEQYPACSLVVFVLAGSKFELVSNAARAFWGAKRVGSAGVVWADHAKRHHLKAALKLSTATRHCKST